MQFSTSFIIVLLSSTAFGSATAPSYAAAFRRSLENEVWTRQLNDLGLTHREDHPNAALVKSEVDLPPNRQCQSCKDDGYCSRDPRPRTPSPEPASKKATKATKAKKVGSH